MTRKFMKTTTVRFDEEMNTRAAELKINISQVCRDAVWEAVLKAELKNKQMEAARSSGQPEV